VHGRGTAFALVVALAACCGPATGQPAPVPGAPYVPTPDPVVDAALELAGTGPGDRVVDLGSGDGRIPIRAVTRFRAASGFGVEIDPALVRLANDNARAAGVADRVRFAEGDLFAADVRNATVVTVYLVPSMMGRVERKLRAELAPGARVVVHDYPFPDWRPERVVGSDSPEKVRATGETTVVLYLYRVPPRPR
jgi:cyclopropane fatty-acyl-phospholipid synthase-like methyltransferase